jgi:uncharacterized protein (TIGR02246 family)
MSTIARVLVLAWAAVLGGCAQLERPSMQDASVVESEVRAAEAALMRALESSDPTAWVDHYTEDAVFVGPWGPAVQGRAALLAMARSMHRLSSVVITPLRTETSGRMASVYARGSWTSGAQGPKTAIRVLIVWRQERDGRWRVAQELLHLDPEAK